MDKRMETKPGRARWLSRAVAVEAGGLIAYLFMRSRSHDWRATRSEAGGPLPGDDEIRNPYIAVTRAVTIDAPPEDVWPWLVRADGPMGWYSCGRMAEDGPSGSSEPQELQVGEQLLTCRSGSSYQVARMERDRTMILAFHAAHAEISRAVVLQNRGGRTRLLFRMRIQWHRGVFGLIPLLLSESGSLLSARKQIHALKAMVEKESRLPQAPTR